MPWHLIKHAFERSREKYGSDVDRKEYERQRKEDYKLIPLEFLQQFSGDNPVSRFLREKSPYNDSVYGFKLDRLSDTDIRSYFNEKIDQEFAMKKGTLHELREMELDLKARKNAVSEEILRKDDPSGIDILLTPSVYVAAASFCKLREQRGDNGDRCDRYYGTMICLSSPEVQFLLSVNHKPVTEEDIILLFLQADLFRENAAYPENIKATIKSLGSPPFEKMTSSKSSVRSLYEILVDLKQAPSNFWALEMDDDSQRKS